MSSALQAMIDELSDEVEYMGNAAGSHGVPVSGFEKGVQVLRLIPELFEKIRHGEPGHEAWLKEAIEAHFLGLPMPDYVAK